MITVFDFVMVFVFLLARRVLSSWCQWNRSVLSSTQLDIMNALNLIFHYLTGRKQRVKINSSLSSYLDIFQGVPQWSILGPLLFNLFLCWGNWYFELSRWWHSVCVFWKCWRHSGKIRRSRKNTFYMVLKQFLKG